ncbi:hypothetical protein E9531_13505 [Lampropedia puyangensis]|uniref:Uncharacterized protein n=1 Tax=Lampropedia puyangensis TaxID=1330072 RepID=A0A4S8EWF7_9BURK|nr:hypothetical protein [Lampropedia puyangensis]THT98808.1 hypothetical protein E9531_13505 [Lampropedia puyangensis]
MKIHISLEKKERHVNLLWALFAITEPFSHERNDITFISDDGLYAFTIRTDINYVAFGPSEQLDRPDLWTENIARGEIEKLFCRFLSSQYDELQSFPWISKEL